MKQLANLYRTFFSLIIALSTISCSKQNEPIQELPRAKTALTDGGFSFWQFKAFYQQVQMGYAIQTYDNNIVMVDGGGTASAMEVEKFLTELGGVVDTWIITHPHSDHIGTLLTIIGRKKIKINKIIHASLREDWVKKNEPRHYQGVLAYNKVLKDSKIPVFNVKRGSRFALGKGVELKIISAQNETITQNAINNSSLVFKVESRLKSILFLGDLGAKGGDQLLQIAAPDELRADYVQMAHHGQSGVSKNVYEAVRADYALWPTPLWLWENRVKNGKINSGKWRTLVVRQWMADLETRKNYVSGKDGTIRID